MGIRIEWGMSAEEAAEAIQNASELDMWAEDITCLAKLMDDDRLRLLLDVLRKEAERRGLDG